MYETSWKVLLSLPVFWKSRLCYNFFKNGGNAYAEQYNDQ